MSYAIDEYMRRNGPPRDRYEAEEMMRRMDQEYRDRIRHLEYELMNKTVMAAPSFNIEAKKAPAVKPVPQPRSKLLLLL